jgi:Protein of unknown function (DUF4239)
MLLWRRSSLGPEHSSRPPGQRRSIQGLASDGADADAKKLRNPIALSFLALACIIGGIVLGALLRGQLPEQSLAGDAKDVVRLGTGLIGTIAALVLGLLIAAAKSSHDTQNAQIRQMTANIILLDSLLAEFGGEARVPRELLRQVVINLVNRVWHDSRPNVVAPYEASTEAEAFSAQIQRLSPQTEAQHSLHARMIKMTTDLWRTRLLLFTEKDDALPMPFLVVLVFWITIIFASFSLFAQPTPMVIGELLVFALSVSGAIYLILELSQPFGGLMQIRSEPLRNALLPLDSKR